MATSCALWRAVANHGTPTVCLFRPHAGMRYPGTDWRNTCAAYNPKRRGPGEGERPREPKLDIKPQGSGLHSRAGISAGSGFWPARYRSELRCRRPLDCGGLPPLFLPRPWGDNWRASHENRAAWPPAQVSCSRAREGFKDTAGDYVRFLSRLGQMQVLQPTRAIAVANHGTPTVCLFRPHAGMRYPGTDWRNTCAALHHTAKGCPGPTDQAGVVRAVGPR